MSTEKHQEQAMAEYEKFINQFFLLGEPLLRLKPAENPFTYRPSTSMPAVQWKPV